MFCVFDVFNRFEAFAVGSVGAVLTDLLIELGGFKLDPSDAGSMNTLYDQSGITPTIPDDLGEAIGYVEDS